MTNIRLHTKIWPLLLLASAPAWSAIFGTSGDASTPPAPAQPTTQSAPESTPTSPVAVPSTSAPAETSMQREALKQKLLEAAGDPKKLGEVLKTLQEIGGIDESTISPKETSTDKLKVAQQELQALQNRNKETSEDESLNDEAFQLLLEKALPLSPAQIKLMHKLYDVTQQASAESPTTPPSPVSTSNIIHLDPGNTPPVIRLSAGFVTSLVFSDSTGAPWPIASYTLGDPTAFNIQWDQRSNTLFVQSLKLYSHGNLAVTLHGLSTPVMLSMVSGQKQVDFRIDFQIAGRGPEAVAPIMPESFQDAKVNPILINVLDGIAPRGSIKLNVSGDLGEAWLHDNKLYFRTRLTVLSPAWTGTVSSPDGMHVYEMLSTPTILASKDGQTIDIRLTGL